MFIVVGLLYIIHMTPFPSQEMRGTTVQPGGNWLSLCQKIPSFLHQHICFASCLFSTWDRVTKHYNHNRKKRTFVKKGPKKDQKRTISAVWSLRGPSPELRTFLEAVPISDPRAEAPEKSEILHLLRISEFLGFQWQKC